MTEYGFILRLWQRPKSNTLKQCSKQSFLFSLLSCSHLHRVNGCLCCGSSQRPSQKPLVSFDFPWFTGQQLLKLNTDRDTLDCIRAVSQCVCKTTDPFISHELNGRLWSDLQDVNTVSSPQRHQASLLQHLFKTPDQTDLVAFRRMNLSMKVSKGQLRK